MAGVLYQLGSFQFSLTNGSPENVSRTIAWSWPEQGRILRKPALQYLGPESTSINLSGVLYPGHTGKQATIDDIAEVANTGEPQQLSDGLGRVYGRFSILSLKEDRGVLMDTGAARRIAFTIELAEYGEDNPGERGSPLSASYSGAPSDLARQVASATTAFTGDASAFDLTSWIFGGTTAATTAGDAMAAGYSSNQLGAIAGVVQNDAALPGVLSSFGIGGLSSAQSGGWSSLGIDPAKILESVSAGTGATSMGLLLDPLKTAGGSALGAIGGSTLDSLTKILDQSSTLGVILDVDPVVTSSVRSLLGL